ncbi:MAG: sugar ABC transporter substrate-binding protein [Blastocatellales bacterium]|nr:sugar ABC transporter substrate-binding protein [Blastocatellales bacterium]
MKKLFVIILGMILALIAACNRDQTASDGRPTVALVVKTLNNPFFNDMQKGAEEAARRLGVNLLVQAAEREVDVEKQMQIIENLIQSRVSALVITPSGSKEIVPAIVKANQAGIPVIILDTRVNEEALAAAGGKVAAFIGSDNQEGGRLAGELMVKALGGRGQVAILEGIPGHETGDSRMKGFRQAVSAAPDIQIVSSQTANWERDQGYNVFQNMLQAQPRIQGLFACSDLMALGAVEAIRAAGKTGSIVVIGFDAFSEAREAVRNGLMLATVAQFPSEMGRQGVESAALLLKGEQIQPEMTVRIELITRGNAEGSSQ